MTREGPYRQGNMGLDVAGEQEDTQAVDLLSGEDRDRQFGLGELVEQGK